MASRHEILRANRRARRKRFFRRLTSAVIFFTIILLVGGWYLSSHPSFVLTRLIIAGAEITWGTPRAAKVSEHEPAALWCQTEGCYFVDRTGLLSAPAPQFSNAALFTLTGLVLPIPVGSRPLSTPNFQRLLDLRAAVNQLLQNTPDFAAQTITAVSLGESVDYVFEVRAVRLTPDSWRLLVARGDSADIIVSRLTAVFSAPAFLADYHLPSSTLESLDVRFDRKVFYKFM